MEQKKTAEELVTDRLAVMLSSRRMFPGNEARRYASIIIEEVDKARREVIKQLEAEKEVELGKVKK